MYWLNWKPIFQSSFSFFRFCTLLFRFYRFFVFSYGLAAFFISKVFQSICVIFGNLYFLVDFNDFFFLSFWMLVLRIWLKAVSFFSYKDKFACGNFIFFFFVPVVTKRCVFCKLVCFDCLKFKLYFIITKTPFN